jgi:acyl-CoA dehydrogenase
MDFAYSPKVQELRERVQAFMDAHVYPAEKIFYKQVEEGGRWKPTAIVEASGTCSCRTRSWASV